MPVVSSCTVLMIIPNLIVWLRVLLVTVKDRAACAVFFAETESVLLSVHIVTAMPRISSISISLFHGFIHVFGPVFVPLLCLCRCPYPSMLV